MPCLECETCNDFVDDSTPVCAEINYADTLCAPEDVHPLKCTYWSGSNIDCLGIEQGDNSEEVVIKIADAICAVTDPTYTSLVKVSAQDTSGGYLQSKIVAGTGISIVKQNVGANENLCINSSLVESPLVLTSTDNMLGITPNVSDDHQVALIVKKATDVGNILEKRSTGLYVPPHSFELKVTSADTEGYLQEKLIAGSNVTITKVTTSGVETLVIASSGGGGLTNVSTQSSETIQFNGNGSTGTPLTASIILSEDLSNIATLDPTDGSLLVVAEDKYVKISLQDTTPSYLENKLQASSSVAITKTGTGANERLQLSTIVDTTQFIRNGTSTQSSSNFNISGTGQMATLRVATEAYIVAPTTTGAYTILVLNNTTGKIEKITPAAFLTQFQCSDPIIG